MSRNFEEEYKAHMNQEVPDLWDRIESSLPPKDAAPTPIPIEQPRRRGRLSNAFPVLIAACICGILFMPSIFGRKSSSSYEGDYAASSDACAEESVESAENTASAESADGNIQAEVLEIKETLQKEDADYILFEVQIVTSEDWEEGERLLLVMKEDAKWQPQAGEVYDFLISEEESWASDLGAYTVVEKIFP